jgi:hypothetical protein
MQISIDRGPGLEASVQTQIHARRYASLDEVVCAGLVLFEEASAMCEGHEQRPREAVREGRNTYLDLPIEVARARNRARLNSLGGRPD